MKFSLPLTLSTAVLLALPSCTDVRPGPDGMTVAEAGGGTPTQAPFGFNGTQTTIKKDTSGGRTSGSGGRTRPVSTSGVNNPDREVTNPKPPKKKPDNPKPPKPDRSKPKPPVDTTPKRVEKLALPHPTNPDLVLNPFNPKQPLRVKNLSSGKPDLKKGSRFVVPGGPKHEVIIIP